MSTQPPVAEGTVARGSVVQESADYLRLNTNPCGGGTIIMFRRKYEKKDAGEVTCRTGFLGLFKRTHKIVQVTQLRPEI